MKIENKDNYVILADEYNKINDFVSFLDYQIPAKFKGQNVVLNLLDYNALMLEQLILFMKVNTKHRGTNQSFVIVTNTVNPDDIPEELFVVPTLQEAEDIIEMEAIERDLGF
jgi:hypothetical protein